MLCTYIENEEADTPEGQYMCGSTTAAKMAQDAGAKRLVLVHQVDKMDDPGETERAVRDVARHYDGQIVWGRELMRV